MIVSAQPKPPSSTEVINGLRDACQEGDPRWFVEAYLQITDKQKGQLVPFLFKPTQEKVYEDIFGDGLFEGPTDRMVDKARQVYFSALMAYCTFALRACTPNLNVFCGVPVEGDDVHKQMVDYDNDCWLSLPTDIKRYLGIVRGDALKVKEGQDKPQYFWNTERHDIVFLDEQGNIAGKSSIVYRPSTVKNAGTGGNYLIQWFSDAGKYNAETEQDFYVSLRRASVEGKTLRVWEGTPQGKVHATTGQNKYFYDLYESMLKEPQAHEKIIFLYWFDNPDYELEPGVAAPGIHSEDDEAYATSLIRQAYPDISAAQLATKMNWRRQEITAYTQAAHGDRERGLALFRQENLEDHRLAWNDAQFGAFKQAMLIRLQENYVKPIETYQRAGLTTNIYFGPLSGDLFTGYMDIAGEHPRGDKTSIHVISCANARVVAEIFGNAQDDETARQYFELMLRYRGVLDFENNGSIAQPYQRLFKELCQQYRIQMDGFIERRGPTDQELMNENIYSSPSFITRLWGTQTTQDTKNVWYELLREHINGNELRGVPLETLEALRAYDPNNKHKHTSDRVISLMGANRLRHKYKNRVSAPNVDIGFPGFVSRPTTRVYQQQVTADRW